MTISTRVTPPPDLPDKTEQNQTLFDARISAWFAWWKNDLEPEINDMVDEFNALAVVVNGYKTDAEEAQTAGEDARDDAEAAQEAAEQARDLAQLAGNFQGEWSGLTGSLLKGDTVEHNDTLWLAVVAIADVTASEPSTSNSDWLKLGASIETGQIILSTEHAVTGYLALDGSTVLKSSYPTINSLPALTHITFTTATDSGVVLGTSDLYGVASNGTIWVIVGHGGTIAYSTDGDNWTAATDSGSVLGTDLIRDVAYNGSVFVAVSRYGGIAYSTDGDNWTAATDSRVIFGSDNIYGVVAKESTFVIVGNNGKIAYSTDGDNWTAATDSGSVLGTRGVWGVTASDTTFVIVGHGGTIAYSTDGDNWTAATDSGSVLGPATLYGVSYNGSVFVAVGAAGVAAYSTDGDIWNKAANSDIGSNYLTYNDITGDISNIFLAVVQSGRIVYSPDGVNWITHPDKPLAATTANGCGGNGSTYVVVGGDGKIGYGTVLSTTLYLPPVQVAGAIGLLKY